MQDVPIYQDYLPDRDTDYPTWSWTGCSGRVSFSLILELDNAGIDLGFDDDVDLATQPTFDEEDARRKGLDKLLSAPLFNRTLNREPLNYRGLQFQL